ncbi:MAG: hypothetical protein IPM26_15185 [Saprospiraceae bacterium]|nr:hypothetical protein [Saprospiraceae bacterium]
MSITSFTGFDDNILRRCDKTQRTGHRMIAWMLCLNIGIFYSCTLHFFNISVYHPALLYFIVFFMSYIFLAYSRMILATHDHDLAYYHSRKELLPFKTDFSTFLRMSVIFIFVLIAGTGLLLWTTEALFFDVTERLKSGFYDHQPEILTEFRIINRDFDSLDNISDRLRLLPLILGPRKWIIFLPFLFTSIIFLMPFYMKMYLRELSDGEYERLESEIESEIAVSQYELSWNIVNEIRKEKFGLQAIRYESFYDPPFNNRRRFPPLDIVLKKEH